MGAEFFLFLLLKVVVTALVAVGISVAIENSGHVIGGVLMGLPITAGPGYVFLALQATPEFVAESAAFSFAIVAANMVFVMIFVLVARHARPLPTMIACLVGWFACALLVDAAPSPRWIGLVLNALLFALSIPLIRGSRSVARFGRRAARQELLIRAVGAGTLVGLVVTVSEAIGSSVTGIAMLFPVTLLTIGWIMQTRYGPGPATAVMAGALIAMPGFGLAVLALSLLAEPVGVTPSLLIALVMCLAWAGATLWFRRNRSGVAVGP